MREPAWRIRLEENLDENRDQPTSRYLQLATVDEQGRPSNRTMVFRRFREGSDDLMILTHTRSPKVAQLVKTPWAEVAWYFFRSREQFRIFGRTTVIDENVDDPALIAQRESVWRETSSQIRAQFGWPDPGLAWDDRTDEVCLATAQAAVNSDGPPPRFGIVILHPERVDLLDLKAELFHPYRRVVFHLNNGIWTEARVNA